MTFGNRAPTQGPLRPRHMALAGLILIVGAAVRIQGAQGDLWLDEIWSLNLAATMTAWSDVLWNLIHDNSHPLNTLYLYLVGPGQAPWVYRLASVVAGTFSIAAAGWAVARGGRQRILITMAITAVLYPLVQYGSEARGYALMMLFAYIAFGAVERAQRPTGAMRWVFAGALTLGALSHLSILPVALAFAVAFAAKRVQGGRSIWSAVHDTVRFSAPAAGGLALVGAGIVYGLNNLTQGWYGGASVPCPGAGCFVGALGSIVRFSSGGYDAGGPALYAGVFAVAVGGAIVWLSVLGRSRANLYGAVFFLTPLIYIALDQPNAPFGRYFLAMIAFVPLLLSDVVVELHQRSQLARRIGGLAVIALISVNGSAMIKAYPAPRGVYLETYNAITHNSQKSPITIGSDQSFRVRTVFGFMAQQAGLKQDITYIAPQEVIAKRPDWLILVTRKDKLTKNQLCYETPPAAAASAAGPALPLVYLWISSSSYWGMSGANWDLYRRLPTPAKVCPQSTPGSR